MGSRPLRMKVQWGCPPRVLSHRRTGPRADSHACPGSRKPSRLDDRFYGVGRGSQPCPAPLPFFPEVHEELTKSWMAPFTARSPSSASSILITLDGGVARGYAGIPQVERPEPTKRRHLEEPSASPVQVL